MLSRASVFRLRTLVSGSHFIIKATATATNPTPTVFPVHPHVSLRHLSTAVPVWVGSTAPSLRPVVHADKITSFRDSGLSDGAVIGIWGRGESGVPFRTIEAISRSALKDLTIVRESCDVDDFGLELLLKEKKIKKIVSSNLDALGSIDATLLKDINTECRPLSQIHLGLAQSKYGGRQARALAADKPAPETDASIQLDVTIAKADRIRRGTLMVDRPTSSFELFSAANRVIAEISKQWIVPPRHTYASNAVNLVVHGPSGFRRTISDHFDSIRVHSKPILVTLGVLAATALYWKPAILTTAAQAMIIVPITIICLIGFAVFWAVVFAALLWDDYWASFQETGVYSKDKSTRNQSNAIPEQGTSDPIHTDTHIEPQQR